MKTFDLNGIVKTWIFLSVLNIAAVKVDVFFCRVLRYFGFLLLIPSPTFWTYQLEIKLT